jgi:hypothetical protein
MEKRTLERIPVNVDVEFYCNDRVYHGTVKNLSEKGFRLPVNLARMTTSPDSSDALGVEVQEPSREYLEFVYSMRFVYES